MFNVVLFLNYLHWLALVAAFGHAVWLFQVVALGGGAFFDVLEFIEVVLPSLLPVALSSSFCCVVMQSRLGSTQLLFLVRPSLACSTRVNRFLDFDCRDPHVDFPHSSPRSVRSAVCCLVDFSWSHLALALGTGQASRIICCRSTCSIICTRLVKRTWKGHEKNKERTCKEHGADMRRAWRGHGVAMENTWKGRGEDVERQEREAVSERSLRRGRVRGSTSQQR